MDRQDLIDLREGRLPFEAFAKRSREGLEARARWFIRHWPGQGVLDVPDLVQEMLVTAWSAVDRWDPERLDKRGERVPIERYVDWQVGKRATNMLRWSLGWPRPRRSRPARAVQESALRRRGRDGEARQTTIADLLPPVEANQQRDVERNEAIVGVLTKLEPHDLAYEALLRIAEGETMAQAALAIYRDPAKRLAHMLDCEDHARVRVSAAVRRAVADTLGGAQAD